MKTTKRLFRILPKSFWADVTQAVYQPLFYSLLLVIVISFVFSAGLLYSTQSTLNLQAYGMNHLLGGYLVGIDREIVSLLVAIVILLIAGLSFASEMANMKASEQIDLLSMTGIDPIDYLVLPRLVAGVILTVSLTVLGWIFGFFGGSVAAYGMGVEMTSFFQSARDFFQPSFIWIGLLKALVIGIIIGVVPTWCGISLKISNSLEVRRATIIAAVVSFILLAAIFLFFSLFFKYPGVVI